MVRLRSGEATDRDRERLDSWLAEAPIHRQEFERLAAMWNTLDHAKSLLEIELREAEAEYQRRATAPSRLGWRRPGRLLVAAGALATFLILLISWWGLPPKAIRYHTAKGEQRQVTLMDGSSVTLNTASEVIAQFSDKERLVVLDHGEAWFEVRHDEMRPFRVQVANGVVHDVGTQFIVNRSPEQVLVSVLEGIVEVRVAAPPESRAGAQPAVLRHGEQLWYDANGRLSSVASFNESMIGAWREGKLIFQTQPLEQVLAEISRYRPEEIRLLDPALKSAPVSGVFNIRDVRSFVQALQDALPIQATWINPQLVIVERAPATATHRKP
jgi:transmembrane sensor